jgi:hypothetical protein
MSKLINNRKKADKFSNPFVEREDMNAPHPGAVCGECGRTVTMGEYSGGQSSCCKAGVTAEEEYGNPPFLASESKSKSIEKRKGNCGACGSQICPQCNKCPGCSVGGTMCKCKGDDPYKTSAISEADDMCEACGKRVANRECAHGILCDKCDKEIHGKKGGPCKVAKKEVKLATDLVSKATLEQAMQEARGAAQKLDRNSPEHRTLEEMFNFINDILTKTPEEIKQDGGQSLTDYFDDAKMPQFAGKLRSAVEKINQLRSAKPMATHASLTKMDAKLKAKVRDALGSITDSVGYSAKQECLVAKHGYFYTHGYDERKFADAIVKRLNAVGLRANIVSTSNHWHAWPTDSWFECRFTVEPSPLAVTEPAPAEPTYTGAAGVPGGVGGIKPETPVTSAIKEATPEIDEEVRPETHFYGNLVKYDQDDLVDICNTKYGWAIAEQLKSILEGEAFEEQNPNALQYILEFALRKKETELAKSIQEYLTKIGYDKNKGASTKIADSEVNSGAAPAPSTAPSAPAPAAVPVIAAEKVAMPLNYEQILAPKGFVKDPAPHKDGEEVYWNGPEAVVAYSDGNWEVFGGNGPNDVVQEGHGPEELQTYFNLLAQDEFENRKGSDMNKRASKKIAEEPIEETPIVEEEDDVMPIEDAPVDEAAAGPTIGLDPASLGTKALGAAIKALAGVPEFMDDKSAVLWIEQLSSILKDRPVEQKQAKGKGPGKCECGAKCVPGSDMCGACEKEYALANEKAASKKIAVTPPGISEELMHKLKSEYPGEPDKAYATAWKIHNEKSSSEKAAAWDNVRNKLKTAGVKAADAIAWGMKEDGYTPNRAAYLVSRNASYFAKKYAMGGGGGGGFTSNEETLEVDKPESEGASRVKEIGEAHKMRDDNTGIDRPETTLPIKLAAELTPTKALKSCEDAKEELKKLYLELKPVSKVNDVAAVRNAIEAIWSASVLFDDACKAFNKMIMADEAEEEAVKASKKEASIPEEPKLGGLVLASAE